MKKRRSDESPGLEDAERTLHTSFCAAANSISQLYTQAQQQHKIAFQAGQRHALEKLFAWIHNQHGTTPSIVDILNYLKIEMESVNQTETTITQTHSIPLQAQSILSLSQQQLAPPNPFGRTSMEEQRPPSNQGFFPG